MNAVPACVLLTAALATPAQVSAGGRDSRMREVIYDPRAVVSVSVKRGTATLIELGPDEAIRDVASGLGGDCSKAAAAWCISSKPGSRHLFVKAKSGAEAPNNLTVISSRRTHTFRLQVLPEGDPREPTYHLVVRAPAPAPKPLQAPTHSNTLPAPLEAVALPGPNPRAELEERLSQKPGPVNTQYSMAEGEHSQDIVPTLVFDDGRFTYFRFPGNREVPAVFHVLPDGSEALVNSRREDDLVVVDRVSRRLMLRAGSAVIAVWNDAFDLHGAPPQHGTAAEGVQRELNEPSGPDQLPAPDRRTP